MSGAEQIFRWMHILAGVLWIGLLYFFNWVNGPFAKTLDADCKKKVVPELLPRALFWFCWGAAWTWVTGVVLLFLVFYHSPNLLPGGVSWSVSTWVLVAVTFLGVFLYDFLFKMVKDPKIGPTIGFVGIAVVLFLMAGWGNFSYRGYLIHVGTLFGTIMAFNVWFRIWPAQQKIITAIKNGKAPDADLVALAGTRSKHNTYLSVPLFWTMINTHHATTFFSGNRYLPAEYAWATMLLITLLGWHIVWQCYRKSGKVGGF